MARNRDLSAQSLPGGEIDRELNIVDDVGDGAEHSGKPSADVAGQSALSVAGGGPLNLADNHGSRHDRSAELAATLLDVAVRNFGHPQDPLIKTHPLLASFLFRKSWNKIELRESAVITITVSPVGVAASLKMPSEAQQLTSRCSFVSELLDRLENDLANRTGEWKELKSGSGAQKIRENRKKMVEIEKAKK